MSFKDECNKRFSKKERPDYFKVVRVELSLLLEKDGWEEGCGGHVLYLDNLAQFYISNCTLRGNKEDSEEFKKYPRPDITFNPPMEGTSLQAAKAVLKQVREAITKTLEAGASA